MKLITILCLMMTLAHLSTADEYSVFFGTSRKDSKGIYTTRFDSSKGRLGKSADLAVRIDSPGFLAQHPELPILYSTGIDPESGEAVIAAFSLDNSGGKPALQAVGQIPTGCGHATHLTVHPSGRLLATAHYGNGRVAVFSLDENGRLLSRAQEIKLKDFSGVVADRQEGPHPHYVTFDPSGEFLLVPDLGADAIHVYKVNTDAQVLSLHEKVSSAPGTGPRHMKFSNDGRFAFVLNELSLTVDSYSWDQTTGTMRPLSSANALPDELLNAEPENTASEILVHPNGNFVYTGNRGNDSISVFRLDKDSGGLERIQVIPTRTAWPRHFNIDPSGNWIVCGGQDSANAGVFSIDTKTGLLTYQPHSSIPVPSPICIHFVR